MPPDDYNSKIEIELLKKDVVTMTTLFSKFDVTLEKLQEIATDLSKIISLQEQRLSNQEKSMQEVQDTMELRRKEHNVDVKELHNRIDLVSNKIDETERRILNELHSMREEQKKDKSSLGQRLSEIEFWKYTVVGGLMVATWIAAKVDLIKILFTH